MLARSIINPQLWWNTNKNKISSQLLYQLQQVCWLCFHPVMEGNLVKIWTFSATLFLHSRAYTVLCTPDHIWLLYFSYSVHVILIYFIGIPITRYTMTWAPITDQADTFIQTNASFTFTFDSFSTLGKDVLGYEYDTFHSSITFRHF